MHGRSPAAPVRLYEGTKHTAATAMLERSGGDIEAVREYLGHTDAATTRLYAKTRPRRLEALVRPRDDTTKDGGSGSNR